MPCIQELSKIIEDNSLNKVQKRLIYGVNDMDDPLKKKYFWGAMREISRGYDSERRSHSATSRKTLLAYFILSFSIYVLMQLAGFSQATASFTSFLMAFFFVAQCIIHILLCIETAVLWHKDNHETHLKVKYGAKLEGGSWKI